MCKMFNEGPIYHHLVESLQGTSVEICIFVPEFIDSATALLISASVPAVIVYLVVLSHAYCLAK